MDRLNFGTLDGYYAIECGNILGLGGAFFAALSAVKNVTPFAYCDGADIMSEGRLNSARIAIGMGICLLSILAAYIHYFRKDLR